jgi:hypothetical protein
MLRYARGMILILGLLAVVGCQSPTTADSSGDVTMTFDPSPTTPGGPDGRTFLIRNANKPDQTVPYDHVANFTITLKNSAKKAATIMACTIVVQQATGGIVVTPTTGDSEHYDFTQAPTSNVVAANGGAVTSAFQIWYWLPNGGAEAIVTVNYSFRDEDDITFSKSASVRIVP